MNFDQLVTLCSDTQRQFVAAAGRTINTHLAARNFLLGLYIVHFEQEGEDRASYGKQTLKALSSALKTAAGRGFSVDNLELMRRFFIHFRSEILRPEISETPSRISLPDAPQKSETPSRISLNQKHHISPNLPYKPRFWRDINDPKILNVVEDFADTVCVIFQTLSSIFHSADNGHNIWKFCGDVFFMSGKYPERGKG